MAKVRKRAGSPYYQAHISIRSGRYRRSTGCTDYEKAKEAAIRIEAELRAGVPERVWSFDFAQKKYFGSHARLLPSASNIEYQLGYLNEWFSGPLDKIANPKVQEYVLGRRAVVSNASVNRELTLLRAVLNWCHRKYDQPLPNIDWKAHRRPEPPARDRYLTKEEYDSLLDAAHEEIRPIIMLAVNTGLRKGNLLGLTWRQVDLQNRRISLTVKGNKRHSVRLNAHAFTALANLPNREGGVFDRTNFRKRWESALKGAGIGDFRFHDLRHTFASWLLMGGARLIEVCHALGHSDISMTQRYAHLEQSRAADVFDLLTPQNPAQEGGNSLKTNRKA